MQNPKPYGSLPAYHYHTIFFPPRASPRITSELPVGGISFFCELPIFTPPGLQPSSNSFSRGFRACRLE